MAVSSPLQYIEISTAAAGQGALIAADTQGRKIRVVSYVLVAGAAVTVKFQSGNTDITGAMPLAANGGVVVTSEPVSPVFETASNTALNINLGGAVQVSGHLAYFLE